VLRAGRRIPPYDETRRYVPKVLAWRHHYAREFADLTPPPDAVQPAPRRLR
jgi:soluble lytic murein transglycosylase-like protein